MTPNPGINMTPNAAASTPTPAVKTALVGASTAPHGNAPTATATATTAATTTPTATATPTVTATAAAAAAAPQPRAVLHLDLVVAPGGLLRVPGSARLANLHLQTYYEVLQRLLLVRRVKACRVHLPLRRAPSGLLPHKEVAQR
jgi:hypothetical protein